MPLSPLQLLTPAQTAALQAMVSQTGPVAQAMSEGVLDDTGSTQQLPLAVPIMGAVGNPRTLQAIWPLMTSSQQNLAIQTTLVALAVLMVQFNLQPPVTPPVVVTIPLAPITTTPGSLTFTNGILTAYTAPA